MKRRVALLFLALMAIAHYSNAQVYKTVGPDGKIIYSDTPPTGSAPKYDVIQTPSRAPDTTSSADSNPESSDGMGTSKSYGAKKARRVKHGDQADAGARAGEGSASGNKTWDEWRKESSRLFMARDFEGAINAEKQAMAIAEKASSNDPRLIKSLHAMASANRFLGRDGQAIPLYERAVKISDSGASSPQLSLILADLADAYKAVGRDGDAKKTLERASAMQRR